METVLQCRDLVKQFGTLTALDIPNLDIPKGQALGLVGNNGAGKTTLFRLILDLIEPTRGEVLSKGKNVRREEQWKSYTGSYIDEGFLIDYLTPDEYFRFIGRLISLSTDELHARLNRLEPLFHGEITGQRKYIRDLSKGNQKKVGIAGALLIEPEILILDEPFANLDPSSQFQLRALLKEWHTQTGMTMLISSHDLGHVTEFCERIVVLNKGEVVRDILTDAGTLSELEDYFARQVQES
jgi:ABC-2 type transport system ATP-binding protein